MQDYPSLSLSHLYIYRNEGYFLLGVFTDRHIPAQQERCPKTKLRIYRGFNTCAWAQYMCLGFNTSAWASIQVPGLQYKCLGFNTSAWASIQVPGLQYKCLGFNTSAWASIQVPGLQYMQHWEPRHMYELGAQALVLGAHADEHATDTLPLHKLLSTKY